MTRRVLNFLTALSLLLFMAMCALWLRSYFVVDLHYRAGAHADGTEWVRTNVDSVSAEGRLCVVVARHRTTGTQADFARWKAEPSAERGRPFIRAPEPESEPRR